MPKLTTPQAEIAKDKHRFRVVCVGRRGGKTTLAVEEIKGIAIYKESRIAYIAPTYQQARDIAWQMLVKEFKSIAVKINESRLELEVKNIKNTTSLIQLRGWESIETLRGQSFDFLVIDEVASMRNFWVNWQEVLRPTLTDRKGEALFISTPKGFNHFYDLYNTELKDKDFKSFHFTSYDNPYIPSEEIDLAKNQMTPDRFEQEYLASFKKTEGLVYKEFSREKHLYDTLPDGIYQYIAGIDFGYRNPAAVAHIYFNGEKYYLEDEWYKRERTDTQLAEYVSACKFEEVYPDPENPSAIEELRNRGVNTREVIKGKDSIIAGIQKVRELFLNNKFLINRKCINTIYELETYSNDENNAERNENEKPIDKNNHLLDSIRYVVSMTWDIKQPTRHDIYNLEQIRKERRNEFV
jgi:PBSX family phage terminase large subunit